MIGLNFMSKENPGFIPAGPGSINNSKNGGMRCENTITQ